MVNRELGPECNLIWSLILGAPVLHNLIFSYTSYYSSLPVTIVPP